MRCVGNLFFKKKIKIGMINKLTGWHDNRLCLEIPFVTFTTIIFIKINISTLVFDYFIFFFKKNYNNFFYKILWRKSNKENKLDARWEELPLETRVLDQI